MKRGTKSLLFGVHQFIWHPITVWLAWVHLYKEIPTLEESFCILVHDWGYWGKTNMDDAEGELHPEVGAAIADRLFGAEFRDLCLFHSRHYARLQGAIPSKLCWADKVCIKFEFKWLYLLRAWSTGELYEYRACSAKAGYVPITDSHSKWYNWIYERSVKIDLSNPDIPLSNPER